ncbi:ABC transporter permease [Pimelobacter sp. 30-1]|uniref:ABC transporter permease n=1 Tax=Pimelobacter sp. 30-1 TaxID=2004991 RepID=UPI001C04B9DC|nr:ABC transporter permease [Pimelobacter sp. 30-1]MBU2695298.1 hypothetical protein [Pimelobacter sp. 30-1]
MTTAPSSAVPVAAPRPRIPDNVARLSQVLAWPATRAFLALAVLLAISPLVASGSISSTALYSMLPFAAITTLVAVGQTLVIQQGGLDLSVPGAVTLGALIVAKFGNDQSWGLPVAVVVAILGTSLFGLLSGVVVTAFRLPPLVVTIATNALLIGVVQVVSGGFGAQADPRLSDFALGRFLGVPVLVWIAAAVVIAAQVLLKLSRTGRRFELVGESRRAADVLGLLSLGYGVAAYWFSALAAGAAGVMLAGLLRSPTLTAGDSYLLPSIAAVVLGGTALTGGRGSLVGTALGAVFLAQLAQLVQTFTSLTAVQNVVTALIIGVGIVLQLRLGQSPARLIALFRPRRGEPVRT